MKTENLKAKGLTDEQIAYVMAENGKDVNALKGEISKLQTDLKNKDTALQNKLAEVEFSSALEKAVVGAKAKNAKAVMALLDVDMLKESKNQSTDIIAALEAVKKDNSYLFEGAAAPRVVGPTSGPAQDAPDAKSKANEGLRGLFGKGE